MLITKILNVLMLPMLVCSCGMKSEKPSQPVSEVKQVQVSVPEFNADSAYQYVKRQVDFGFRIPNTPEHAATAAYLSDELRRHGAEVIVQEARVIAYDGTVLNAKNIIGSFSPEKKNRILLFAHWDSRPFADHDPDEANHRKPVTGANDGASGVGVLLEMARLIGKNQPSAGIDIIFFDAEDYGTPEFYEGNYVEDSWALGTQYWARRPHKAGYRAKYGILLDMVGGKDAVFARERISDRYAPQIVDKVWNEAKSLGYGQYFDDTPGGSIQDDHVYVNKVGIPSIDIIQYVAGNETSFNPQWHTVHDTMEYIDRETLKAVGQTVLSVIYKEK